MTQPLMGSGDTWINALIGAAVTIGLSFTGFSPIIGGGVAGYLQAQSPKQGAKVGALSGVIAMIPLLGLVVIGFSMFTAIPMTGHGLAGGVELIVLVLMLVPFALVWFIGLSAAGGYLGGYVQTDDQPA